MMNRGIPKHVRKKAWMNSRCLVRYLIAAYLIGYGMGIIADKYWLYEYVPLPTLVEMKQSRSCDVIFSSQRPLYKEDDWQYLRDLWSSQQQQEKTNYKIIKTKNNNNNNTKFISPIQSGQTIDGKGRGLFATRDIKRGEMTYNGGWGDHLIKFQNGQSYRKFVYAIEDDGMACECDVMDISIRELPYIPC